MPDIATSPQAAASPQQVDDFIARWQTAQAAEKSNGQLFLVELSGLISATVPDACVADTTRDAYVFERPVTYAGGDWGIADLYRRAHFVLETKQGFDGKVQSEGATWSVPPLPWHEADSFRRYSFAATQCQHRR